MEVNLSKLPEIVKDREAWYATVLEIAKSRTQLCDWTTTWIYYIGCYGKTWTNFLANPISVQFSHSVGSDSLQPHGLQHARSPCPSPIPRVYSNSYPLSRWFHPVIASSVIPFSSCLQSFPASGLFKWVRSSHQVAKVLFSSIQCIYSKIKNCIKSSLEDHILHRLLSTLISLLRLKVILSKLLQTYMLHLAHFVLKVTSFQGII